MPTLPLWQIILILGIIEGLTEFIPVSSTGHLILANEFLHFKEVIGNEEKTKLFDVFIQSGAIFAIALIYREKLIGLATRSLKKAGPERKLLFSLIIGFLPAALVGLVVHNFIEKYLFSPLTVAWALVIGGMLMLIIERLPIRSKSYNMEQIAPGQALWIGFAQVLSLFPGISRSGSTIMGGMCVGLDRKTATEFSFLLSFPILVCASLFVLKKHWALIDAQMIGVLFWGSVASFICAWIIVKWLIRFVQNHTFDGFAVYRILFGIVLLWFFWPKK